MRIKPFVIVIGLISISWVAIPTKKIEAGTGQGSVPNVTDRLREEYVKATNDYKASLQKLLTLYQDSGRKAEQRREQMQKLQATGLVGRHEVEIAESAVSEAKLKISGVEQQIAKADEQISAAIAELERPKIKANIARQYKRAVARQPSCRRWTLKPSGGFTPNRPGEHAPFGGEQGGKVVFKVVCGR